MQEMPDTNELAGGAPGSPSGILDRALELVRFLRAGCPWDAAQTPVSLTAYLLEESLELADAIIESAPEHVLRAELGDLLLNLAFQIVLAEERGTFDAEEVVVELERKMRRRHPHLYGDAERRPDWEAEKANERTSDDVFEGLARRLDPLSRAQRLQDRAAGVGFDWENARDAFTKVQEEMHEVAAHLESGEREALQLELGDLLFACVNIARLSGLHAATALRLANAKFERRFAHLTRLAGERGLELGKASLEELDELWEETKDRERDED